MSLFGKIRKVVTKDPGIKQGLGAGKGLGGLVEGAFGVGKTQRKAAKAPQQAFQTGMAGIQGLYGQYQPILQRELALTGYSPQAYQQQMQQAQEQLRAGQAERGIFASGPAAAQEAQVMPQVAQQLNQNIIAQLMGIQQGMTPYLGAYSSMISPGISGQGTAAQLQMQGSQNFMNMLSGGMMGGQQSGMSGMFSGATGGAGQSAGMAAMFCWIAAELYGENSIEFILARHWIFDVWKGVIASIIQKLYLKFGPSIAKFIRYNKVSRRLLKKLFDRAVILGRKDIMREGDI